MNDSLLCSVLISTRKRLSLLKQVIHSIIDTANDKKCFEIIIRVQTDDEETMRAIPEIKEIHTSVRIITGPPMRGFQDLELFYDECAALAVESEFIWIGSDDSIIMSKGWDDEVRKAPKRHILMPEKSGNGYSIYYNDMSCGFMFVPNGCWREYGAYKFGEPLDYWLWTILRENGWPTYHLPGVAIWHVRDANSPHVELLSK